MEVIKILGQASPAATTAGTIYTVPTDKGAVISVMNIVNRNVYDATIRLQIVKSGEEASLKHYVEYDLIIYGNTSIQKLKGVTLAQGDFIRIYASSEHISFNLFGSEFDQTFEYPVIV